MHFPLSGVDTYWWLPALTAFVISVLSATGGLSGAFLLLPFQVSVLHFTGPAVSPTNLIFNMVAIPSGVYRYWREKRLVWPLVAAITIGTLPGLFFGALIRIKWLLDPRAFKLFVGLVLLYIASRILVDLLRKTVKTAAPAGGFLVSRQSFTLQRLLYEFNGQEYRVKTWSLMLLSFIVGIIGGTYGIGGGAIIAPFLVAVFRLPVHTIAGASLLGTFISSAAGVFIYTAMAPFYAGSGINISPDWMLGGLFGLGGAAGIYLGARLQRYLPARLIKGILLALLLFASLQYIVGFFL
ncbi:MAG: sulfite exporter TauE/SafE family protein [Candidatus Zixiibacteriota bacterium]|nr:MAG: sulfite exporter TauE/SafE family protein [candidate division Zixibacteria bacterium]